MDSETSYKSANVLSFLANVLSFLAEREYQIEFTPSRDKHAEGIAERMVGLVTAKINTSMMENIAPNYMWSWAMFKATQDLNFNYNSKRLIRRRTTL